MITCSINLSHYKNQILATFIANIFSLSHGVALGWLSPTLHLLQSDQSPLDSGKVTVEEGSWIGSTLSLGTAFGNLFYGFLIEKFGRKWTIYSLSVPHLAFWFIVLFAEDVNYLYIARFLAGVAGGGSFATVPIFVAEIVENKIRGRLASFFQVILNFGTVIGYIISSYIPYSTVPLIGMICPLFFMISMAFMAETPHYHIKNNNVKGAERSLKFYRNYKGTEREDIELHQFVDDLQVSILGSEHDQDKVVIADFLNRTAIKAILIALFLLLLNQFSGAFAIINYGTIIFEQTNSTFDKKISTILVGLLQLIGTCFSAVLIDKVGRKLLLLVSSISMSLGLIVASTFSYVSDYQNLNEYSWIPVTSICLTIFFASIGITPVPFVVLVEILPGKIRSPGSTFCLICLSFMAFTVLKIFQPLVVLIDISGVLGCCAAICAVSSFIIYFFVPETKGKLLEKADTLNFKTSRSLKWNIFRSLSRPTL